MNPIEFAMSTSPGMTEQIMLTKRGSRWCLEALSIQGLTNVNALSGLVKVSTRMEG